jgi:hypothetical protein
MIKTFPFSGRGRRHPYHKSLAHRRDERQLLVYIILLLNAPLFQRMQVVISLSIRRSWTL